MEDIPKASLDWLQKKSTKSYEHTSHLLKEKLDSWSYHKEPVRHSDWVDRLWKINSSTSTSLRISQINRRSKIKDLMCSTEKIGSYQPLLNSVKPDSSSWCGRISDSYGLEVEILQQNTFHDEWNISSENDSRLESSFWGVSFRSFGWSSWKRYRYRLHTSYYQKTDWSLSQSSSGPYECNNR